MKVELVNVEKGEFKVTIDSYGEFLKYNSLVDKKNVTTSVDPSALTPKRRYRKHAKKCEVCGKTFRGNIGLALHKTRAHEGKNWYKNGSPKVEPISNFIPVKAAV